MIELSFTEPLDVEAPDLIEPVVAFRSWRVIDGRLRSPYAPVFWDDPVLTAECSRLAAAKPNRRFGESHRAPGSNCSCGIYAYPMPDPRPSTIDFRAVTGIVTVWGAIEVHLDGIRAEHARVEALALYSRWSDRQKRAVWSIADKMGLDLVDLSEVNDMAERYGMRLPGSLLPPPSRAVE